MPIVNAKRIHSRHLYFWKMQSPMYERLEILNWGRRKRKMMSSDRKKAVFRIARKQFDEIARKTRQKIHSTKKPDERYIDPIRYKLDTGIYLSRAFNQIYGDTEPSLKLYGDCKTWLCDNGWKIKEKSHLRRALKKLEKLHPDHKSYQSISPQK